MQKVCCGKGVNPPASTCAHLRPFEIFPKQGGGCGTEPIDDDDRLLIDLVDESVFGACTSSASSSDCSECAEEEKAEEEEQEEADPEVVYDPDDEDIGERHLEKPADWPELIEGQPYSYRSGGNHEKGNYYQRIVVSCVLKSDRHQHKNCCEKRRNVSTKTVAHFGSLEPIAFLSVWLRKGLGSELA